LSGNLTVNGLWYAYLGSSLSGPICRMGSCSNLEYVIFFHGYSGYVNLPQCYIYTYIACFVCNLHHFAQKRRALRRRTWCGHASRKSLSFIAPSLQTIDENSADFFKKECLSTTIQELANNSKTLSVFMFSVPS
jgi:hypothetical protein